MTQVNGTLVVSFRYTTERHGGPNNVEYDILPASGATLDYLCAIAEEVAGNGEPVQADITQYASGRTLRSYSVGNGALTIVTPSDSARPLEVRLRSARVEDYARLHKAIVRDMRLSETATREVSRFDRFRRSR